MPLFCWYETIQSFIHCSVSKHLWVSIWTSNFFKPHGENVETFAISLCFWSGWWKHQCNCYFIWKVFSDLLALWLMETWYLCTAQPRRWVLTFFLKCARHHAEFWAYNEESYRPALSFKTCNLEGGITAHPCITCEIINCRMQAFMRTQRGPQKCGTESAGLAAFWVSVVVRGGELRQLLNISHSYYSPHWLKITSFSQELLQIRRPPSLHSKHPYLFWILE